jgi:hypothetical protein
MQNHYTAANFVQAASAAADLAFRIFDAKAAASTPVTITPTTTLAGLLAALPGHTKARQQAAELAGELKKGVADAVAILDQGIAYGEGLLKAINFIEHGGSASEVPPELYAEALAVREAHLSGVLDATGLIAECRRSISAGIGELHRSETWVAQTKSAAGCATSKLKHKTLQAIGAPAREIKACKDSASRHLLIHNAKFGPGTSDQGRRLRRERNIARQKVRAIARKLEAKHGR